MTWLPRAWFPVASREKAVCSVVCIDYVLVVDASSPFAWIRATHRARFVCVCVVLLLRSLVGQCPRQLAVSRQLSLQSQPGPSARSRSWVRWRNTCLQSPDLSCSPWLDAGVWRVLICQCRGRFRRPNKASGGQHFSWSVLVAGFPALCCPRCTYCFRCDIIQ